MHSKLARSFYRGEDTLAISRSLLGKVLFTRFEGVVTGGRVIETEAYMGAQDRACHAYGDRRTPRTEMMYAAGGVTYVYLCYGMHNLLNIVTHKQGVPHAVLIRAIEPLVGVETMLRRRKQKKVSTHLTAGPAMLTQALGITREDNGKSLCSSDIWLEDWGDDPEDIIASPRVGVDYAGEDAALPFRFRIVCS